VPELRRVWRLTVTAFALAVASLQLAAAQNAFPSIAAAYIVKKGDNVLWAAAEHERLPPASLTKIMTALLVLESGRLDTIVTVSARAAAQSGTRLRLKGGERMRVVDLLNAALLASANDACYALAEAAGGSQLRFVQRMNRRAQELRLDDTHFVNACGFDAPGHLSSAADLARLAEVALRDPRFARLVAQPQAVVRSADGQRAWRIVNTNALVGRLPGAVGVKSGYTRRAGKCVVALVERDGVRVLMVLLRGANRWWDAHGVIERAFATQGP
jgi:D-alanyl-D-alanine carboxypeptidase (penicillin-binding protein 5/6)